MNVFSSEAHLRKLVCAFALARENMEEQKLALLHDNYATISLRASWQSFFNNMKKVHVFAEGPVLYVTAIMLERDRAVMSFGTIQETHTCTYLPRQFRIPPPPSIWGT